MRRHLYPLMLLAAVACGGEDTEETTPAQRGQPLYTNSCAGCHGADGKTAVVQGAADLTAMAVQQKTDDALAAIVRDGQNNGAMPAFSSQYNASQISDIIAYVRTLK